MPSDAPSSQSTAELQGELWGARAEAWAEQEPQSTPMYDQAIRLVGIRSGTSVLDVGCGSGSFCRSAADHGADVSGLDASAALIEAAQTRVPEGDFRVGDLQFLPYEDHTFDVVTGFNSFQFAANSVTALGEAGRVSQPGGVVVAVVWGRPERVGLTVLMRAFAPLLPAPPGAPGPSLSEPGALESACAEAGLAVRESGDGRLTFEYADQETMLRGITSAGAVVRVARAAGDEAVRAVVAETMERFRTPAGGYRLENDWHYVVARA